MNSALVSIEIIEKSELIANCDRFLEITSRKLRPVNKLGVGVGAKPLPIISSPSFEGRGQGDGRLVTSDKTLCSFSFFLNAKRKKTEPKERKTGLAVLVSIRGKAPEPPNWSQIVTGYKSELIANCDRFIFAIKRGMSLRGATEGSKACPELVSAYYKCEE